MKIGGLAKLTLLDYPEKVACTIFTRGCNLRCPFCHNASLVCGETQDYSTEEVLAFLSKRKTVLQGICLSGGEPLLQRDVAQFLSQVKAMGYLVKLDTNGTQPQVLQSLINDGLVDYVAMDVKNSPSRYDATCGVAVDLQAIKQSVDLLKSGVVDYEFRTTVTGNFHDEQSVADMAQWLVDAKRWYLQQFVDSGDLIDGNAYGCSEQTLRHYCDVAKQIVPCVATRGI